MRVGGGLHPPQLLRPDAVFCLRGEAHVEGRQCRSGGRAPPGSPGVTRRPCASRPPLGDVGIVGQNLLHADARRLFGHQLADVSQAHQARRHLAHGGGVRAVHIVLAPAAPLDCGVGPGDVRVSANMRPMAKSLVHSAFRMQWITGMFRPVAWFTSTAPCRPGKCR